MLVDLVNTEMGRTPSTRSLDFSSELFNWSWQSALELKGIGDCWELDWEWWVPAADSSIEQNRPPLPHTKKATRKKGIIKRILCNFFLFIEKPADTIPCYSFNRAVYPLCLIYSAKKVPQFIMRIISICCNTKWWLKFLAYVAILLRTLKISRTKTPHFSVR